MDSYIHARLPELYCKVQNTEFKVPAPEYTPTVMNGHITWSTHFHTIACRQSMWQPQPSKCMWCGKKNAIRHMLEEFAYRDIVMYVWYPKLAVMVRDILPPWKQCIPTPCGLWVQRGGVTVFLHVVRDLGAHVSHISLCITPDGEVTTDTTHALEKLGAEEHKQQKLLGFILTTIHWLRTPTSLPLMLQDFCAPNDAPMTHFVLAKQHQVPKHSWVSYPDVRVVWPPAFLVGQHIPLSCVHT